MGNIDIHALGQKVVHQVFLHGNAALPAIRSEVLAHAEPPFLGVDACQGRAKLSEHILKGQGALLAYQVRMTKHELPAGKDLPADVIDSGHVPALHPTEEMAGGWAELGVNVTMLHQVANEFHPMLGTPVPNLIGEAFPDKTGHRVHKDALRLSE